MKIITTVSWDKALWQKAKEIYIEAFGRHGGKPEKIIRNMFNKQICALHVASEDHEVVAMALTGSLKGSHVLLIDYLAVRHDARGQGVGKEFVDKLKAWAISKNLYDSLLLEAECEDTTENLHRIQFWERCGFTLLTDYIHHYIWVPEPYMAMVLELKDGNTTPDSGKTCFTFIEKFHKRSFQAIKD